MSRPQAAAGTPPRFVVGLDLGTTNSACAYVDTGADPRLVQILPIPQHVAPGVVEARDTLPSFHYQAAPGEFPPSALRLPWDSGASGETVGILARDHGGNVPARQIASAKSWLCHPGVDRTAELLPWHAADDVRRLSPVQAIAAYLSHLRAAWDARFAEFPLAEQDVILTLPASFDEVARELTIKAARLAGLTRVVLLEEPQAAFYAWIWHQGDQWDQRVLPGQKILVCDVGGGTTDFTLIRVERASAPEQSAGAGAVRFHRVAVGDHLILGGDNLDLALAHHVEGRLGGTEGLPPRQWTSLVRSCRTVKETLLGESPPESLRISLPSGGSRLVGAAKQIEVRRDEVQALLLDGFLPFVALDARPSNRQSGFQEFGLPYAADPAITRYLAAFLTAHRASGAAGETITIAGVDPARPDLILFNGGLFASPVFGARLLDVVASWFSTGTTGEDWRPTLLTNPRLDLAVAQGAAYYGLVRRGQGVRIVAGLARSYYLGVQAIGSASEPGRAGEDIVSTDPAGPSPPDAPRAESSRADIVRAICLLPANVQEGQDVALPNRFLLTVRQPVEFPLFASSTRLTDPAGALLAIEPEQLRALPPIRTVLQAGRKADADAIRVRLHSRLNEIGTMEVWCQEDEGARSWRLEFDVRAATQTDLTGHVGLAEQLGILDEAQVEAARAPLVATFGSVAATKPESTIRQLEQILGLVRREWPPSLLRSLWATLVECEAGRRRSAEHEARWLYLVGYSLRPGYGLAVDDWRVATTWKLLQGKRSYHTPACRTEWLIMWRRLAGGLSAGQQRALAEPLWSGLRPTTTKSGKTRSQGELPTGHELAETWRLLAALEWLPAMERMEIGDVLLKRLGRERVGGVREAAFWALGRLGSRVPQYGPLNTCVPSSQVSQWVQAVLRLDRMGDVPVFPVVQLTRRVGDRQRDLPLAVREEVLSWLSSRGAPAHYLQLVSDGGELATEEQSLAVGESLPPGLRTL